MNKVKSDILFQEIAEVVAKQSYCEKRKVGAVIVKDGNIIGFGFNGTPSGRPNVCEIQSEEGLVTKSEVLHAESNAIMKVAKSTLSTVGSTLYVTCEPCIECSKLIIQAGITRVVYRDEYRIHDGLDLLKDSNIIVDRFTEITLESNINLVNRYKSIITEFLITESELDDYNPTEPLIALGLDDLDIIDLIMNIESEFNISIPDHQLPSFDQVSLVDIDNLVTSKLTEL